MRRDATRVPKNFTEVCVFNDDVCCGETRCDHRVNGLSVINTYLFSRMRCSIAKLFYTC